MEGSTGILFPKYSTWAFCPAHPESSPTHTDLRVVTVKDPLCHIDRLPESAHSDIYSTHPGGAMREETSS